MARKALIVNADGYGFTYGNNEGIRTCLKAGFVKSVSINANFPASEEAVRLREWPGISTGIHFNLSVGRPLTAPGRIPHLVGEDGHFLGRGLARRLILGQIPSGEIRTELRAQASHLQQLGVRLSHWDGHQNKHLIPGFFLAACDVAREFGIVCLRSPRRHLFSASKGGPVSRAVHLATHPGRALRYGAAAALGRYARRRAFRSADRLLCPGILDEEWKDDLGFWESLLANLPDGVNEIYCHPGIPDETLRQNSTYVEGRERELQVLSRGELLLTAAANAGVSVISFWEI
ncbi:MAG TPA: ChbG/HpnK family deacetylase [Thermoanaerobaculia bacterium]|nr:ChbG/HpnK family deacetylase [Thermoanaerobaculia bacterium]